jgi:hypothetical protein
MIKLPIKRGRKNGGKKCFYGLVEDAKALGRTPHHLWLVLSGRRISPILIERWNNLKASQEQRVTERASTPKKEPVAA